MNRVARLAKDRFGLLAVFLPHTETHVEYEDQIERFLADTDRSLIGLRLDIGHHAYRRGNPGRPLAFARKHHTRQNYLPLKTVIGRRLDEVVYQGGASLAAATVQGVFCEPDQGVVNFASLRHLLHKVNFDGFAIMEQDMYPAPFGKPLPIANRSLAYFRQIGFGWHRSKNYRAASSSSCAT